MLSSLHIAAPHGFLNIAWKNDPLPAGFKLYGT